MTAAHTCPRPATHTPSATVSTTVNGQTVEKTQIGAGSPVSLMSMGLLRRLGLDPILDTPGQVSVRAEVTLGNHTETILIQVLPDGAIKDFDLILSSDWTAAYDSELSERTKSGIFKTAANCTCDLSQLTARSARA